MGVVYAAFDDQLERPVAIKTFADGSAKVTQTPKWPEARAAARTRHPNVCQIYEVAEDQDELLIAKDARTVTQRRPKWQRRSARWVTSRTTGNSSAQHRTYHRASLSYPEARPDTDFLAASVPDAITNSLSGLESLVVRSSAAAARFGAGLLRLYATRGRLAVWGVLCQSSPVPIRGRKLG